MKKLYCTIIDSGSGSSVNDLCAQNDVILLRHHKFLRFLQFLNRFSATKQFQTLYRINN